MYSNGTPTLSRLSDAWEAVTDTKKQLSNIDTKIRHTTDNTSSHSRLPARNSVAFGNPSQRSKHNPNIERRVVVDKQQQQQQQQQQQHRRHHGNENIPPHSIPQPKVHSSYVHRNNNSNRPTDIPVRYTHEYAPDFNYNPTTTTTTTTTTRRSGSSNEGVIDAGVLNSSLCGGKVLLSRKLNDSNALNRLKERIQQQKLNSSITATTATTTTATHRAISPPLQLQVPPSKPVHEEEDLVVAWKDDDDDEDGAEPMTRKVAHAPSAPTYKGFNPSCNRAAGRRAGFPREHPQQQRRTVA
jgi:hypothetical protein